MFSVWCAALISLKTNFDWLGNNNFPSQDSDQGLTVWLKPQTSRPQSRGKGKKSLTWNFFVVTKPGKCVSCDDDDECSRLSRPRSSSTFFFPFSLSSLSKVDCNLNIGPGRDISIPIGIEYQFPARLLAYICFRNEICDASSGRTFCDCLQRWKMAFNYNLLPGIRCGCPYFLISARNSCRWKLELGFRTA